MERRVAGKHRDFGDGVKTDVSAMGGHSVLKHGEPIGWIPASLADQWNAYVRRSDTIGDSLGRLRQEDAVRPIAEVRDRGANLPNGCRP